MCVFVGEVPARSRGAHAFIYFLKPQCLHCHPVTFASARVLWSSWLPGQGAHHIGSMLIIYTTHASISMNTVVRPTKVLLSKNRTELRSSAWGQRATCAGHPAAVAHTGHKLSQGNMHAPAYYTVRNKATGTAHLLESVRERGTTLTCRER